jgi:hypothetical protein
MKSVWILVLIIFMQSRQSMKSIPREAKFSPLCPIAVVFQLLKHPTIPSDINSPGHPEEFFSLCATLLDTGKTERSPPACKRVYPDYRSRRLMDPS